MAHAALKAFSPNINVEESCFTHTVSWETRELSFGERRQPYWSRRTEKHSGPGLTCLQCSELQSHIGVRNVEVETCELTDHGFKWVVVSLIILLVLLSPLLSRFFF